ncbi:MAG: hypothetical protein P1U89_11730 [Verrucomicrobiales bacterium]|nr:hypothetical protein [Verrucomicrobiales bacterium]
MDTLIAEAESFTNEHVLKTMAWVFTMLSGVASITLTIHKFGLPKWKQISLIVGVLGFGLLMVLVVIPSMSTFSGPQVISVQETNQLQALASELGDYSGGYERTEEGFVSKPVRGEVKRVSKFVYAVMHPNGHFDAIYSGDFFKANLDGATINCELIDLGDDRILIVKGSEAEFVDLKSSQDDNTFKIRRVPVPKQA